jgi:RHH-type rel operon transcriptional repressor/antitoxin RelB
MNHVGTAAPAVRRHPRHAVAPCTKGTKCVMLNMFNMLGIRLEPELEEKLESLAKETGRSKSYYAREAIRQYLEDREDYLKGIAALERREPTITLEELERRLGLDD